MRWRVGRRPTVRSIALTSCHGQPVSSARACALMLSPPAPSGCGSEYTVVRTCVIDTDPCPWRSARGQDDCYEPIIGNAAYRCNSVASTFAGTKPGLDG